MDWPLTFIGESCLGEHAIKDQQFITLSLSTNPPVFLLACLSCSHADRNMHRQASPDATEATAFIRNDILSPCSVVLHARRSLFTSDVLPRRGQALSRAILFHGTRRYVNKTPETSPEGTISLCLLDTRARKVVW